MMSEARRVRRESVEESLLGLSTSDLDMVQRAAEVGLDQSDPRPRAINRRHVVSHEYPVPHEVLIF